MTSPFAFRCVIFAVFMPLAVVNFPQASGSTNSALPDPACEIRDAGRCRQPKVRFPPRYPEKCMSKAQTRESVFLRFDVSLEGRTENIRVVGATSDCFTEAAVEAVEGWKYEPAASRIADLESQIVFELPTNYLPLMPTEPAPEGRATCRIFSASTHSFDQVAKDPSLATACKHHPIYPEYCFAKSKDVETVFLTFDVSKKGVVRNIAQFNPDNSCLADAASTWLRRVEYAPSKDGFKHQAAYFRYEKPTAKQAIGTQVPPENR